MVSILLKDKNGIGVPHDEEPWESKVYKGDLVIPIPKEEGRQVKGVTPNYRLYRDAEVVLYADLIDVAPVEEREAEYLLAVYPPSLRLKEYLREDEMKMKMNLIVGDTVVFKLVVQSKAAAGSSVKGIIRYIGPHRDNDNKGIFFGIEIHYLVSCRVVWVRLLSMLMFVFIILYALSWWNVDMRINIASGGKN